MERIVRLPQQTQLVLRLNRKQDTAPMMNPLADIPSWRRLLPRALVSGSAAALASAAAAAQGARAEGTTRAAPMNAVTHAIWPREAPRATRVSMRHTLTGFVIHTCASIFWATAFEALRAKRATSTPATASAASSLSNDVAAAAAISAAAWCVDYHVVPKRFTPGFEVHLGPRSMLGVYSALAAGLIVGACVQRCMSRRGP